MVMCQSKEQFKTNNSRSCIQIRAKNTWKHLSQCIFVNKKKGKRKKEKDTNSWEKSLYSDSLLGMKSQEVVMREKVKGREGERACMKRCGTRADYFLVSGAMDFIIS